MISTQKIKKDLTQNTSCFIGVPPRDGSNFVSSCILWVLRMTLNKANEWNHPHRVRVLRTRQHHRPPPTTVPRVGCVGAKWRCVGVMRVCTHEKGTIHSELPQQHCLFWNHFFSSSSSLSNATNTKTRKGVAHTMSIGEKKKKLLFQTNFHCTNSDPESIAFPFFILSSLLGLFFPWPQSTTTTHSESSRLIFAFFFPWPTMTNRSISRMTMHQIDKTAFPPLFGHPAAKLQLPDWFPKLGASPPKESQLFPIEFGRKTLFFSCHTGGYFIAFCCWEVAHSR